MRAKLPAFRGRERDREIEREVSMVTTNTSWILALSYAIKLICQNGQFFAFSVLFFDSSFCQTCTRTAERIKYLIENISLVLINTLHTICWFMRWTDCVRAYEFGLVWFIFFRTFVESGFIKSTDHSILAFALLSFQCISSLKWNILLFISGKSKTHSQVFGFDGR